MHNSELSFSTFCTYQVDKNIQLMRKFEDQTLQSREMIKEVNDYRQQLQHTRVGKDLNQLHVLFGIKLNQQKLDSS